MAIKIVKATEPLNIKNIIVTLVGKPSVGKTSLAMTAKRPILLDFDNGVHRAKNRRAFIAITKWSDIAQLELADVAEYDTIIIDTAGEVVEHIRVHLGGNMSPQKWGQAKSIFQEFITKIRSFEKDIIIIGHAKEDKKGDSDIVRIDVGGSSKGLINNKTDIMGYLTILGGKRVLSFDTTDEVIGKNCAGILTQEIPDCSDTTFLARLIEDAKSSINAKSQEIIDLEKNAQEVRDIIDTTDVVDGLNQLMLDGRVITSPELKKYLISHATKINCEFSKSKKEFVEIKNETK